jgi:hypothetical protein
LRLPPPSSPSAPRHATRRRTHTPLRTERQMLKESWQWTLQQRQRRGNLRQRQREKDCMAQMMHRQAHTQSCPQSRWQSSSPSSTTTDCTRPLHMAHPRDLCGSLHTSWALHPWQEPQSRRHPRRSTGCARLWYVQETPPLHTHTHAHTLTFTHQRILDHRAVTSGADSSVSEGSSHANGLFEFLVVCEPEGSMECDASRVLPQGRWRCRDCYLKVPPVWSAFNDEVCECGCGCVCSLSLSLSLSHTHTHTHTHMREMICAGRGGVQGVQATRLQVRVLPLGEEGIPPKQPLRLVVPVARPRNPPAPPHALAQGTQTHTHTHKMHTSTLNHSRAHTQACLPELEEEPPALWG